MPQQFDAAAARAAGYGDDEIQAYLAQVREGPPPRLAPPETAPPNFPATAPLAAAPSAAGFLRNVVSSGGKFAGGVAGAVTSPVQTAKAILGLASGIIEKALPGKQPDEVFVDSVLDQYAQRYGSVDKFIETMYGDPINVLADLSIFAGGAGAAAQGVKLATGSARAAKVATVAGRVAQATDPLQAIGRLTGRVVPPVARKLYQSALKPSTAGPKARRAAAEAVGTGLEYEIPVSEAGVEKLTGLVDELNQEIARRVAGASAQGKTVSPRSVAFRVEQIRPTFKQQVNPAADLEALSRSKAEFLAKHTPKGAKVPTPISLAAAQAEKIGTYKQLRKKYGKLGPAEVEAQKALARGLKEEIVKQLHELTELNAHEAKLLNLDQMLEKAVVRLGNRGYITADLFTGGLAGAATGSAKVGAVAGLLRHVLTPEVQSKLAIALNRYAKRTGVARPSMATTFARIRDLTKETAQTGE